MRAKTSIMPPGGKATITRSGLSGHAYPVAGATQDRRSKTASRGFSMATSHLGKPAECLRERHAALDRYPCEIVVAATFKRGRGHIGGDAARHHDDGA